MLLLCARGQPERKLILGCSRSVFGVVAAGKVPVSSAARGMGSDADRGPGCLAPAWLDGHVKTSVQGDAAA